MKHIGLLLAVVLIGTWLLLNGASVPQLLLGSLLTIVLLIAFTAVRPPRARMRNPHIVVALAFMVLVDILRANAAVARLAFRREQVANSGFLDIPLELHDPHALTVLAMIVTSTPGTVWAGITPDGSQLRLHVLDLSDPAGVTRTIKERYERPLKRIFE